MKLNISSNHFKHLKAETNIKSEIKVYDNFIGLISALEQMAFVEEDLQAIEIKLDELDLESCPENKIKYLKKKLSNFKRYLQEDFSLISEGYYTAIGLSLGMAFGAAFGSIYGMGIGVSFGMILGLAIGAYMDSEAKKQNRVL